MYHGKSKTKSNRKISLFLWNGSHHIPPRKLLRKLSQFTAKSYPLSFRQSWLPHTPKSLRFFKWTLPMLAQKPWQMPVWTAILRAFFSIKECRFPHTSRRLNRMHYWKPHINLNRALLLNLSKGNQINIPWTINSHNNSKCLELLVSHNLYRWLLRWSTSRLYG